VYLCHGFRNRTGTDLYSWQQIQAMKICIGMEVSVFVIVCVMSTGITVTLVGNNSYYSLLYFKNIADNI
jgi:hypothetical protein